MSGIGAEEALEWGQWVITSLWYCCKDSRGLLVTQLPEIESLELVDVTRSLIVWFLNQLVLN